MTWTVVQLRRGVVIAAAAVPDDPRERHLLQALAEQVADPRLVASHATAALAWRLPLRRSEEALATEVPILSAPPGTRRSGHLSSARIHVAVLPDYHVVTAATGLRVTSRARTAADAAAGALPDMLVTLDAALRQECQQIPLVRGRRQLAEPAIHQAGRAGLIEAALLAHPGADDLLRALELADPRRETPIESLTSGHLHASGLPQPVPQAPIGTPLGTFYPDFLWPDERLIGEADGAVKYQTADVMMREKEREQVLRDLGYAFVRWTGREILLTPALVIDRIARALGY